MQFFNFGLASWLVLLLLCQNSSAHFIARNGSPLSKTAFFLRPNHFSRGRSGANPTSTPILDLETPASLRAAKNLKRDEIRGGGRLFAYPSFVPQHVLGKNVLGEKSGTFFSKKSGSLPKRIPTQLFTAEKTIDFDEDLFEIDRNGGLWRSNILKRPRRNRINLTRRKLVQENLLSLASLIYPLFLTDAEESEMNEELPDLKVLCLEDLRKEAQECLDLGIGNIMLFPRINPKLKTHHGEEAYNPDGLIPAAVKMLKTEFPDLTIYTDIALDPYTLTGHDGVVSEENPQNVINDLTLSQLTKQALAHAVAGADVVSPSDMMDGRVETIREALDGEGFSGVSILAYCAKFASGLYSPFRDAVGARSNYSPPDKQTYQLSPHNVRESLLEAKLDEEEGADMLMVKPAGLYGDVILRLKNTTLLPIATYHVSGEYAMIKTAAKQGFVHEQKIVFETLKSLKRAGADLIVTYYAKHVAQWLLQDWGTQKNIAQIAF